MTLVSRIDESGQFTFGDLRCENEKWKYMSGFVGVAKKSTVEKAVEKLMSVECAAQRTSVIADATIPPLKTAAVAVAVHSHEKQFDGHQH